MKLRYGVLTYDRYDAIARFTAKFGEEPCTAVRVADGDLGALHRARSWGVDQLLLTLLQAAELTPDPRRAETARRAFDAYVQQHPNAGLDWNQLLNDGWIRIVWGRWGASFALGREMGDHFRQFFHQLCQIPYQDERLVVLPNAEGLVGGHRQCYPGTPALTELVAMGLLAQSDQGYSLEPRSPFVQYAAPWLFARLWEQRGVGPAENEVRLTWWMERYELAQAGWNFAGHLDSVEREQFLQACWDRLLLDDDLLGWEQETRFLGASRCAEHQNPVAAAAAHPLAAPGPALLEQLAWWRTAPEESFTLDPRRRLIYLVDWILGWEESHPGPTQRPLLAAMVAAIPRRPWLLHALADFCAHHGAPLPHLLLEPATTVLGLALLTGYSPPWRFTYGDRQTEVEETTAAQRERWRDGLEFAMHTLSTRREAPAAASDLLAVHEWLARERRRAASQPRSDWPEEQLGMFRAALADWHAPGEGPGSFLSHLADPMMTDLERLLTAAPSPIEHPQATLLLWLVERVPAQRRRGAQLVTDIYVRWMQRTDHVRHERFRPSAGWVVAAAALRRDDPVRLGRLLTPCDFASEVTAAAGVTEESARWTALREVTERIRLHLRLLAWLTERWRAEQPGEQVPDEVYEALRRHLKAFSTEAPADGRVNALDRHAEVMFDQSWFGGEPEPALAGRIAAAVDALPDQQRQELFKELLALVVDSIWLAQLSEALSREGDRRLVQERIEALGEAGLEVQTIGEVPDAVAALLRADQPTRARVLLERFEARERKPQIWRWPDWAFRMRLWADFLEKRYDAIRRARLPDGLQDRSAAQNSLAFFQGLTHLMAGGEFLQAAVNAFELLCRQEPENAAYGVNLFAARVRLATSFPDDRPPEPPELTDMQEVWQAGLRLKSGYAAAQLDETRQVWAENELYLLTRMEEWTGFWQSYGALPPDLKLRPEVGAFAVQVRLRSKARHGARQLLEQMVERHGRHPLLERLAQELDGAAAPPVKPVAVWVDEAVYEELLEMPQPGIFKVLTADGQIAGTAFLVARTGLVATCAHVIHPEGGALLTEIWLECVATGHRLQAGVLTYLEDEDLAILKVEGDLPPEVVPLPLGRPAKTTRHPFSSFGFPRQGYDAGTWAHGSVAGMIPQKHRIQLHCNELTAGFSGAPIWHEESQSVIGVMSNYTDADPNQRLISVAYMIPVERLLRIYPALGGINEGGI